jgi:hypothetical protein
VAEEALAGRRHPLLDEYDALLDGRLYEAYRPLAQQHPDARFLLTTRDKEAWMLSRITHVLFNRVRGLPTWREISTEYSSKLWDSHYGQVHEFFRGSPRCLTIDVCAGEGWEKLCPFLGKPIPAQDFPAANRAKDRFSRLESCPCCRRPFETSHEP